MVCSRSSEEPTQSKNEVNSVFKVPRVTKANEGSYLCKAVSEAGTTEEMVQVIVLEEGQQPISPHQGPPQGGGAWPGYNNRPDYNRFVLLLEIPNPGWSCMYNARLVYLSIIASFFYQY